MTVDLYGVPFAIEGVSVDRRPVGCKRPEPADASSVVLVLDRACELLDHPIFSVVAAQIYDRQRSGASARSVRLANIATLPSNDAPLLV